jgi:transcription-repair coupling factor (superfamily II helicase)
VENLRHKREADPETRYTPAIKLPPPSIDLPLTAYIPTDYIEDAEQRVGMYKSMAECNSLDEYFTLEKDLSDRFGKPPVEVTNLLYVIEMRVRAMLAMIGSVTKEGNKIVLRRMAGLTFDVDSDLNKRRGVRVALNQIQIHYTDDPAVWQENIRYTLMELGPEN